MSSYNWNNTSQWSTLGGNNQNANSATTSPATPTPSTQNPNTTSTPQVPRHEMVSNLYKYILGREADQAGLNYYIANYQLTEAQIAKDMYESTEHQQILQKAKDVREVLQKLEDAYKKSQELEHHLNNANSLLESYKALLKDPNAQVTLPNGQTTTTSLQTVTTAPVQESPVNPENQTLDLSNESNFILSDPFAEDYQKPGKGCFGMIKKFFKFN